MILPDIWFSIVGFILFLAVVLDGFDLGVGILSLFTQSENRRAILMGSVGAFWHANLTWLVILGGLFFGAFPLGYGVILSALYIPMIVMIVALAFRGVSFEFWAEAKDKYVWNLTFGLGSLAATLAQGFAAGGFLAGLRVRGDQFAGSVWDWLNPFAALVALALLCGYMLLGSTWVILKTEGEVQHDGYRYAQTAAWALLILAVAIGVWSIYKNPFLARKWFTWPEAWLIFTPLLLAGVGFILLIRSLLKLQENAPFLWSVILFALAMFAAAASIHPYIIPPSITLKTAAAPYLIQRVMLIVIIFILPIMLAYNAYNYVVFRGKVTKGGYGA
jgi:cytochrome d ubiquinol oxidase subunit II